MFVFTICIVGLGESAEEVTPNTAPSNVRLDSAFALLPSPVRILLFALFDIVIPELAAARLATLSAIDDEKFDSSASDPIVTESSISNIPNEPVEVAEPLITPFAPPLNCKLTSPLPVTKFIIPLALVVPIVILLSLVLLYEITASLLLLAPPKFILLK